MQMTASHSTYGNPILSRPEDGEQKFDALLAANLTEAEQPVFAEPWQAQAFAITVALYNQGLFTWGEWAETLSEQLKERVSPGEARDGDPYYESWLAALESIVADRAGIPADLLAELKDRWELAYHTTPHGEKVELMK